MTSVSPSSGAAGYGHGGHRRSGVCSPVAGRRTTADAMVKNGCGGAAAAEPSSSSTMAMMGDKRDEEILDLKQKLIELMKENNEMKELILFLDDERNYARQFVRDFNTKQSLNWNSLKQKLGYLEQKQFELIKENYSLKQLCVLLDDNQHQHQHQVAAAAPDAKPCGTEPTPASASSGSAVCQYIVQLEQELKARGAALGPRPKPVADVLKLNALRQETAIAEERSILYSLSESAIKSFFPR